MPRFRLLLSLALTLTSLAVASVPSGGVNVAAATAPQSGAPPKLVVILVMDQFRADYVEMYSPRWTSGLRRLTREGAVFTRAAYSYGGTLTCAGHATIGTGAFPKDHGMTGNAWYDRITRRVVQCAADPAATSVPFGGVPGRERYSATSLRIPTFSDELQRQTPGSRVVSVALKPRSAIMLGGRGDDDSVVVWEEDDGTWATSDAFTKTPWADVDAFVRAHPLAAAYGQSWTKMRPPQTYRFTDDAVGEGQPGGWTRMFPHPIDGAAGKPDGVFVSRWERSPWSDEYVTDLAIHLVETRQLGRRDRTDFLSISLPALDLVGHEYGPNSHEVQDVLARADRTIGRLLDALDENVGAGKYTLGFSSDHGVASIPEQLAARGQSAGRVVTNEITRAADAAVAKYLGPGSYIGRLEGMQLSLTPGTVDRLRETSGALDAVRDAIQQVNGIWRVHGPDEVQNTTPTSDDILQAWRLSYAPGRSGDFMLTPQPNWLIRGGTGTTHGTPHDYDRRVPVILFGAGIRRGSYSSAATPADIAPTLAMMTGVTLPRANGRALTEALSRR
jgi:predicted AlkP superfamily pyrophosphatase or phosphodiesterase